MTAFLLSLVAAGATIAGVVEVGPGECRVDLVCPKGKLHRMFVPCEKAIVDYEVK